MKRLILIACLLVPSVAHAQTTVQIRRGTPMFFEHDDQSVLVTEKYEICEDQVDTTHCHLITGVAKIGTTNGMSTFRFPLPTAVTNGTHIYVLRAFGEGEWSDPSNSFTVKVTGKPLPPQNFRMTDPEATAAPPTNPPAVVR